ncbi:MAG: ferredoxin reductase, partial [Gammaproteobacteria bacterium]|nr:ferredoxin reductase [Gammaproteobacteria bacterium]
MAFVIVGGGHAAGQAAASLRQEGYDGEIVILADEPHIPYQRPPLSKQYLAGEQGIDRVYLRAEKFYADKDVDVRMAVRAAGIDRDAKTVVLEDGGKVPYDKLLLATGARPRILDIPGAGLPGVHYLRTIADSDAIKADMAPGKRLAVVGGGYIGLEVASVAVTAGLSVTVVEMEERILQRVTTPAMSAFYHALHGDAGVTIRTEARAEAFVGTDAVTGVRCADGSEIPADIVVVGVGIVPNVEVAADAGLACEDGIVVDERCTTADLDILAAGDCTNHPNPLLDRRLRLESVPNAMEQARVAAANMAGQDRVYSSVPWFWSDQYDLKLQMVGFSADGDTAVTRGDPEARRFAVFHLKDGPLVAADAVTSPREFMACRPQVGQRVDAAQL